MDPRIDIDSLISSLPDNVRRDVQRQLTNRIPITIELQFGHNGGVPIPSSGGPYRIVGVTTTSSGNGGRHSALNTASEPGCGPVRFVTISSDATNSFTGAQPNIFRPSNSSTPLHHFGYVPRSLLNGAAPLNGGGGVALNAVNMASVHTTSLSQLDANGGVYMRAEGVSGNSNIFVPQSSNRSSYSVNGAGPFNCPQRGTDPDANIRSYVLSSVAPNNGGGGTVINTSCNSAAYFHSTQVLATNNNARGGNARSNAAPLNGVVGTVNGTAETYMTLSSCTHSTSVPLGGGGGGGGRGVGMNNCAACFNATQIFSANTNASGGRVGHRAGSSRDVGVAVGRRARLGARINTITNGVTSCNAPDTNASCGSVRSCAALLHGDNAGGARINTTVNRASYNATQFLAIDNNASGGNAQSRTRPLNAVCGAVDGGSDVVPYYDVGRARVNTNANGATSCNSTQVLTSDTYASGANVRSYDAPLNGDCGAVNYDDDAVTVRSGGVPVYGAGGARINTTASGAVPVYAAQVFSAATNASGGNVRSNAAPLNGVGSAVNGGSGAVTYCGAGNARRNTIANGAESVNGTGLFFVRVRRALLNSVEGTESIVTGIDALPSAIGRALSGPTLYEPRSIQSSAMNASAAQRNASGAPNANNALPLSVADRPTGSTQSVSSITEERGNDSNDGLRLFSHRSRLDGDELSRLLPRITDLIGDGENMDELRSAIQEYQNIEYSLHGGVYNPQVSQSNDNSDRYSIIVPANLEFDVDLTISCAADPPPEVVQDEPQPSEVNRNRNRDSPRISESYMRAEMRRIYGAPPYHHKRKFPKDR